MNQTLRVALGLALSVGCICARADVIGLAPYAAGAWGQQSDANTGAPYQQAVVVRSGYVVESIRWWGYHGSNSVGASADNFVVMFDGAAQSGALSIVDGANGFAEYTLDIVDAALSSATLSISNDSFDVEWYWQSAQAVGNPDAPHADAVAFQLIGHLGGGGQPLPEPASWALLLGAAGVAAAGRRIQRSRRAG